MTFFLGVLGSAGIAAIRLRRAFVGIEILQSHFLTAIHYVSKQLITIGQVKDNEGHTIELEKKYEVP